MKTLSSQDKLTAFCRRRWSLIRCDRLVSLDIDPFAVMPEMNAVWITRLYTPVVIRRRGYAREAMEALCAGADQEGICLVLSINPYGEMNYAALERFYQSLGFVNNRDASTMLCDEGLLVREPRGL